MKPNDLAYMARVPFPLDDVTGRVALVGCGKQKLETTGAVNAEDLYTGTYFKEVLAACKKQYDHVFILSARYGVVALDAEIKTYDLMLPWSDRKPESLKAINSFTLRCRHPMQRIPGGLWPLGSPIDIHAGRNYARWLPSTTTSVKIRWADWGSIGYRRQKYKELRND